MSANWIAFIASKKSVFQKDSFSSIISKVAVAGIAISVMVMLVSLSILRGYKNLVKNKMAGFSGHIQLQSMATSQHYEYEPFLISAKEIKKIKETQGIQSAYPIIQKACIAKTQNELEGIIIKGLMADNDKSFYESIIKTGRLPVSDKNGRSNEIVISSKLAKALNCDIDSVIRLYFFGKEGLRALAPKICGIYSTGVEEYDKSFAIGSYQDLVSQVIPRDLYKNSVSTQQLAITHLEIKVNNFNNVDKVTDQLNGKLSIDLKAESIKTLQGQVFEWLGYLDKNIEIILILMGLVAAINMITAILILIVDSTALIGLLKSLGAIKLSIAQFFIYLALNIVGLGLIIGNFIALLLIALQYFFKIIKLNEENYYTDYVPVVFYPLDFFLINLFTLFICILAMYLPSRYVGKIEAVKALRFK